MFELAVQTAQFAPSNLVGIAFSFVVKIVTFEFSNESHMLVLLSGNKQKLKCLGGEGEHNFM